MAAKAESIEVDSDTASALKTRAAERGISVSALVAELVPFAIDDAAVAELDRRWAEIEVGQPTITHDEVERWLRTWGTTEFRSWSER
jgi:predicted transcriptional regulator